VHTCEHPIRHKLLQPACTISPNAGWLVCEHTGPDAPVIACSETLTLLELTICPVDGNDGAAHPARHQLRPDQDQLS